MVSLMGGSARPSSSNSQGRRSRSQSRSRSRATSDADPQEGNGHAGSSSNSAMNNFVSSDPTMDFCNNFWSHGTPTEGSSGQEGAYDALMGRMKAAGKMMDDFRSFFKERCASPFQQRSYHRPC